MKKIKTLSKTTGTKMFIKLGKKLWTRYIPIKKNTMSSTKYN